LAGTLGPFLRRSSLFDWTILLYGFFLFVSRRTRRIELTIELLVENRALSSIVPESEHDAVSAVTLDNGLNGP
jgi:hypothetical protein